MEAGAFAFRLRTLVGALRSRSCTKRHGAWSRFWARLGGAGAVLGLHGGANRTRRSPAKGARLQKIEKWCSAKEDLNSLCDYRSQEVHEVLGFPMSVFLCFLYQNSNFLYKSLCVFQPASNFFFFGSDNNLHREYSVKHIAIFIQMVRSNNCNDYHLHSEEKREEKTEAFELLLVKILTHKLSYEWWVCFKLNKTIVSIPLRKVSTSYSHFCLT